MKISKIHLAVSVLALAALACGLAVPGNSSTEPAPTPIVPNNGGGTGGTGGTGGGNPTAPPPSNDRPLFEDDFRGRDTNWGTGTDSDSSVEYANDALQMKVFTTNYYVYSRSSDTEYKNVHIEVTVYNNSADPNAAFGIMCYQQFLDDSYYYAYITPNGDYGIAKAKFVEDPVDLATGASDLIPQNASSYRLGMDCGNGVLTLYVNGQQVDTTTDSEYATGKIALFVWSDEVESGVDVSFDDMIVTELP